MTSPMQPYPHHITHHMTQGHPHHHPQLQQPPPQSSTPQQQQTQQPSHRQPIILSVLQWEQIQKISYIIHEFATEAYANISTNLDDLCNMTTVLNQLISDINTDSQTKYLQQQQHYSSMDIEKNKIYYDGMISIPSHSLGANAPGMTSTLNIKTDASLTLSGTNGQGSSSSSPMSNNNTPTNNTNITNQKSTNNSTTTTTTTTTTNTTNSVSNIDSQKNMVGELIFDDPLNDKPRRRRRTVYSAKRNLKCQHCNVTETPEWRRGPNGDHTLCNACGLHYAKTLKKQNKEKERIEKERAAKAAADGANNNDTNVQPQQHKDSSPSSNTSTPPNSNNGNTNLKSSTSGISSSQTNNSISAAGNGGSMKKEKDIKMTDLPEQSINITMASISPPPVINKKHSIDFVMDNPYVVTNQQPSSSSLQQQQQQSLPQPIPSLQQQQQSLGQISIQQPYLDHY